MSQKIKIVEVGARDGLQNEKQYVDSAIKIDLINRLSETGFSVIEAGAFVSPKWVPQMADTENVFQTIEKHKKISYPVLVPNRIGFDKALSLGVKEIAIFGSASESFSQKNINCSREESLIRFKEICDLAKDHDMKVRGYISCVIACPYDGKTPVSDVVWMAEEFDKLGVYEISLGDTIGVGEPKDVKALLQGLMPELSKEKIALHFHDTYGHAIENIKTGLDFDIMTYDSSVGGLGGCPYAKGATGNVATEDVLNLLHTLGYETGIDIDQVAEIGQWICTHLGRPYQVKYKA